MAQDSTASEEGPESDKIRVLLVDDHNIVRQGIRLLLELDDGIEVVGEASTGDEALVRARSTHPDVVLMDIRIPGTKSVGVSSLNDPLPQPHGHRHDAIAMFHICSGIVIVGLGDT